MADIDTGDRFVASQYHDFSETGIVHRNILERVVAHVKGVNDKISDLEANTTMPEADKTALLARWNKMRLVIRENFGGVR